MHRLRLLISLALLAGLLPGAAAASVELVTRNEALAPGARELSSQTRTLGPRAAPIRFNLVGLHWRGGGEVSFRTRSGGGEWSAWNDSLAEAEDRPDDGTAEAARQDGWTLGSPWWTGPADQIQYRLHGEVTGLRAHFLWSPSTLLRSPSVAEVPAIVPRGSWGADEGIVREPPLYAPSLKLAIVHHTAGSNQYSPEESAAIVRAIQVYHVQANRWNDIGYNFLVDKYGQVFEGRAGGIELNVVGAHVRGFNTGSVGIAVLGTYGATTITQEAEQALADLLAWRLDVAHVDPLATATVISGGNERFGAGTAVSLHTISGHRDAGSTECPGGALYGRLESLAARAATLGLPKLYEPSAVPARLEVQTDGAYAPVLFTARLSDSRPWSVTVIDERSGARVAAAAGTGSAISWSWDGLGLDGLPVDPAGVYRATLSAEGALPASIRLSPSGSQLPGAGVPAEITDLRVAPATLTPNGDTKGDTSRVTIALSIAAEATVHLEDEGGLSVTTLVPSRRLPAGITQIRWDGTSQAGEPVADGRYAIVVTTGSGSDTRSRSSPVLVDRTLGHVVVSPRALSPNGDGRQDVLSIDFQLEQPADVRLTLRSGANPTASFPVGALPAGAHKVIWDDLLLEGLVPDGRYVAAVEATTALGTRRLGAGVIVDRRSPSLAVLSAVARRGATTVRLLLSEAAEVRVRTRLGTRAFQRPAGVSTLTVPGSGQRLRLTAWDSAGNASRAIRVSRRR